MLHARRSAPEQSSTWLSSYAASRKTSTGTMLSYMIIYCAKDKVILQVGLSSVLMNTSQHEMPSTDRAVMMDALRKVRLANFQKSPLTSSVSH